MRTLLYGALLAAAVGCKKHESPPPAAGSAGSAPQLPVVLIDAAKVVAPADIVARYGECWSLASAPSCYAPDAVSDFVDSGTPPARGPEAIEARNKAFADAVPDLKGSVELTLVNGRNAAAFALMTGKKLGVQIAHVAHFTEDGKALDRESLYRDLGAARAASDKPWHDNKVVIATNNTTEKTNLELVNEVMNSINDHNADDVGSLLDDKVVWSEQALAKDWAGKAEAVKGLEVRMKAIDDLAMSTDTAWAAGDYVVVQGTLTGTIAKKPVTVKFVQLFELTAGKVTHSWGYWNSAALKPAK
jgi:ketosteroid isomerase-like protein